jgi:SAM-dependent methyltransferase
MMLAGFFQTRAGQSTKWERYRTPFEPEAGVVFLRDHDGKGMGLKRMDFRSVKDVLRHLESGDWSEGIQQENVLEVALDPTLIEEIFDRISSGTDRPVIDESGCGAGWTTTQIQRHLEERGLSEYRIYTHDIREGVLRTARSRFSGDERVKVGLRTGFDFSGFEDDSVDGIFSFNCMLPFLNHYGVTGKKDAHEFFLRETSRVLKEGKPLLLTHFRIPFLMVKDSSKREIPLEIRLFEDHEGISPFFDLLDVIRPIESDAYVKTLVEEGLELRGPKRDLSKDSVSFQRILKTGRVFVPEPWLVSQGYLAVEPSPFTRGKKILWKEKDDFPDEFASSNYSLLKGGQEIPLYLKVELPDLKE